MAKHRSCRKLISEGADVYVIERARLLNVLLEAQAPFGTRGVRWHEQTKLARIRGHVHRMEELLGWPLTDFRDQDVLPAPKDPSRGC